MKGIIGYTGFVGSNISNQLEFDRLYNSKNISDIQNQEFELLVCAGIRAEKFFANRYPEKDMEGINQLIKYLSKVKVKKLLLISTIDVYGKSEEVSEETVINKADLDHYGSNRLYFEEWIQQNFENVSVIRLPALFGNGLKKNFIFDCMNKAPRLIMKEKFIELKQSLGGNLLDDFYFKDENGNYQLQIKEYGDQRLIEFLEANEFTSLVFTDSRNKYPFYNLADIGKDITVVLKNDLALVNFTCESVSAKEIAKECFNMEFQNIIEGREPVVYSIKTIHDHLFGGDNGYFYMKDAVISKIKEFVNGE